VQIVAPFFGRLGKWMISRRSFVRGRKAKGALGAELL